VGERLPRTQDLSSNSSTARKRRRRKERKRRVRKIRRKKGKGKGKGKGKEEEKEEEEKKIFVVASEEIDKEIRNCLLDYGNCFKIIDNAFGRTLKDSLGDLSSS
jgi:hypothetical protein